MHAPQRNFTDTAARYVHDALERQVVCRLHDETHICDGVADFLPLIEAETANHPVGHAQGDQSLLEGACLETGTNQNGRLGQRLPVTAKGLDPIAHHAGLLVRVP